jgi:hypothetical protein
MQTYEEFKAGVLTDIEKYRGERYLSESNDYIRDMRLKIDREGWKEEFGNDVDFWKAGYEVYDERWMYQFASKIYEIPYAQKNVVKHFCMVDPNYFDLFKECEFMKGKDGKEFVVEVLGAMIEKENYVDEYRHSIFLRTLPAHMRSHREIVLMACKISGANYVHMSPSKRLNSDLEIVNAAIESYPLAYLDIPKDLKSNTEIAHRAVDRENGRQILAEADWLYEYKDFALKAVKIDGLLLARYSKFKNDFDVVLEAVKEDGRALSYVSNRLKADEKICITAISNCAEALHYVDECFTSDIEFCLNAFKGDSKSCFLRNCDLNLRCDKSFVQMAIEAYPENYQFISTQLKFDTDIYEPLIKVDGTQYFKYLPLKLRDDLDIVVMALDKAVEHKITDVSKTNQAVSAVLSFAGASIQKIICDDKDIDNCDTYEARSRWNVSAFHSDEYSNGKFVEAEKKIRLFKLSQTLNNDLDKEPPAIKPKRMKI